jgi:glycosyltransferase involved in cell wall biosynthesis
LLYYISHYLDSNTYPFVSVVIPTTDNNPETNLYLKLCLEGITLQTYHNIEIIIVCEGLERSQQLNIGISRSHGKYIFRCDDDWLMQPNVISECVTILETHKADFICVNNIFLKSNSTLREVRRIEREIITSDTTQRNLHIAGNFFRKSDNIIFNEFLYGGEEYELHDRLISKRLSYKVAQSYCLHLRETSSWTKFFRESFYYGKNLKPYISTNPNKMRMSLVRTYYLKDLNRFNSPKLLFGFILFKTLQYTGAFFGYLAGMLQ